MKKTADHTQLSELEVKIDELSSKFDQLSATNKQANMKDVLGRFMIFRMDNKPLDTLTLFKTCLKIFGDEKLPSVTTTTNTVEYNSTASELLDFIKLVDVNIKQMDLSDIDNPTGAISREIDTIKRNNYIESKKSRAEPKGRSITIPTWLKNILRDVATGK